MSVSLQEKEKKMQEEDEAPENEKDNSNEKEIILTPVVVNGNGEGEEAAKEGETPDTEGNKKPKKEKASLLITNVFNIHNLTWLKTNMNLPFHP